jgi:hypothetical protein
MNSVPNNAEISRSPADRLIAQLSEFGAPYFQLTDIVPRERRPFLKRFERS